MKLKFRLLAGNSRDWRTVTLRWRCESNFWRMGRSSKPRDLAVVRNQCPSWQGRTELCQTFWSTDRRCHLGRSLSLQIVRINFCVHNKHFTYRLLKGQRRSFEGWSLVTDCPNKAAGNCSGGESVLRSLVAHILLWKSAQMSLPTHSPTSSRLA